MLLAPRKFVSVTEIVYSPSAVKSALGTTVGEVKLNSELRNAATVEPPRSAPSTAKAAVDQGRPPEPVEEDRSIDQLEQPFRNLAAVITTTGLVAVAGAWINTEALGA